MDSKTRTTDQVHRGRLTLENKQTIDEATRLVCLQNVTISNKTRLLLLLSMLNANTID